MRRTWYVLVLFSMLAGLGFAGMMHGVASAEESKLQISDIAGRKHLPDERWLHVVPD